MKYKAVILDMDGTLLDDNKDISMDNINMLKQLDQMGILIMVATGRRYFFALPPLQKLGIELFVLANNGNSVWDIKDNYKISAKHLEQQVFRGILEMGYNMQLYPVLHADRHEEGFDIVTEYEYTHPAYKGYVREGNKWHRVIDNIKETNDPAIMVMCYADEVEKLKHFQQKIHRKYPQSIHSHITMSLKRIGPLLEISHITGTKWNTAVDLAAEKGIKPKEIVAIGDDNNDIKMIENAGLGVAMKNAIPEVKEIADIITSYDNNRSGVADVLRKLFF